jgi:tetratricopeptide (TPR) repeat protein
MKICSLCLLPRADHERICAICDNSDFEPWPAAGEGDVTAQTIAANHFDLAYLRLERELAEGREDAQRARWLAWLAYTFGDIRAIEIWCHEAARLDPASSEPYLLMGIVLMRAERWPEAVEEFDAGLARPELPVERQALLGTLRAEAFANIPEW